MYRSRYTNNRSRRRRHLVYTNEAYLQTQLMKGRAPPFLLLGWNLTLLQAELEPGLGLLAF